VLDKIAKFPLYAKISIILVGIFVFIAMLYITRGIIVPVIFSTILAILLHPLVNFFVRIGIPRVIAIIIALTISFIIIAGIGILLISQISRFSESLPVLVDKFTVLFNESISWASGYFDITPQKIHEWIASTKVEIINTNGLAIGNKIVDFGSSLVILLLIPVYIFLILFYQPLLRDFISRLYSKDNQGEVFIVVTQIKTVIQRYLVGLVIELVIIATLETAALLILGIEYALLLGIIGALLNLIPYIGGLIAVALPMLIAFATKSSGLYAVYVLIIYLIIQLIDNNYIVPKIVASKVKINALFSIIAVIAGNALWGVPGMFLSIPLLAIVKLIFDHIDSLKPWGFLFGDTMPAIIKLKKIHIKRFKSQKNTKINP
jgi:predicted PurR-regulated permease PerM